MRRLIASAAAAAVLFSALPAAAQAPVLSDLNGHWARTAIQAGVDAGYISGYPDGTFRPNALINRSEFIKILSAALRLPASQVTTGFAEQNTKHWAFTSGYIQSAVAAGLVIPADYGASYQPDTTITRREIVLAAVRALGKEAAVKDHPHVLATKDANLIQPWLRDYAAVAMEEGVLKGLDDGTLGLERNATRAEAVVIVQRILGRVGLNLAPWSGPKAASATRHPGEGEPWWQVVDTQTIKMDQTVAYTIPGTVLGVQLMPAPGKAAWVKYVDGETAVLGYLTKGKFAEVARGQINLLSMDDTGRLWYSDGAQLVRVDRAGAKQSFPTVDERVRVAAFDWAGTLYAYGENRLFKIDTAGLVTAYDLGLVGVQQMAVAEDGPVWFIATVGTTGAQLTAFKIVDGKVEREVPLIGKYAPAPGVATPVGRSGPFAWYSVDGTLYRFDTTDGSFMRMLAPREGYLPLLSPDGGARVMDASGVFWRVLP